MTARDVHVATRLNHEVLQPTLAKNGDATIDGVALADPAKMRPHSLHLEERRSGVVVDDELFVVDERELRLDVGSRRDATVEILIELPKPRERTERDVELAARPFADLPRGAQHLARLAADDHRLLAGGGVETNDVAALAPDAHQRIEPIELREHSFECCGGVRFVCSPRSEIQLRPHADAGSFDERCRIVRGSASRVTGSDENCGRRRDCQRPDAYHLIPDAWPSPEP